MLFSKYAKDSNHRNLLTHSVIPSIFIIILGLILNSPVLIISGFTYFIHVLIDLFDWGTNFFYFPKKTFGPRLFISKEVEVNLPNYLSQYKSPASFFDFKYYKNKIAITIEVLLFILMMVFIILFAFEFILIILIYFLGLIFHLSRHFHLKKVEKS